jgi:hypothetical protein
MDPTTQQKLTDAEEALCQRFQVEDLCAWSSPEGKALSALRALRQEVERLEKINSRTRTTAFGMLEAMKGHSDRRQASLARLGLECLAQTHP